MSLEALESRCNAAACKLDSYQPRKPSLLRIQQLFLYIVTLVNAGNAKDNHAVLAEAMKEAQVINLFLEEKWPPMLNSIKRVAGKRSGISMHEIVCSLSKFLPMLTACVDSTARFCNGGH
jgi:hypothetical protein